MLLRSPCCEALGPATSAQRLNGSDRRSCPIEACCLHAAPCILERAGFGFQATNCTIGGEEHDVTMHFACCSGIMRPKRRNDRKAIPGYPGLALTILILKIQSSGRRDQEHYAIMPMPGRGISFPATS